MKNLRAILIIVLLIAAPSAFADAESERANLARLVDELDALSKTMSDYRHDAAQNRRYRFDYDALYNDIRAMRSGIVEYISKDLSLARDIPPISAQYVKPN